MAAPAGGVLATLRSWVRRPRLLAAALVLTVAALAATVSHYLGALPDGPALWLPWLLAMGSSVGAFAGPTAFQDPSGRRIAIRLSPHARREAGLGVAAVAIYLWTHLWGGASSPWNDYGLFDDAAWDLVFARAHVLAGPYQAAFFDPVGAISRETTFHYYAVAFLGSLGWNLGVFNASLLVLGAITVVGTTFIASRLSGSLVVGALAGLVLNFLPLQYTQVFAGHRYAIVLPLLVVSLALLYAGAGAGGRCRRPALIALSGVAAALCLGSAIMGKQVFLALALAALAMPILDRARWRDPETRAAVVAWAGALLIAAIPLLGYVAFNGEDYFRRDGGLLGDFLAASGRGGQDGAQPYVDRFVEVFIAGGSFLRLWSHDWPLIPLPLYPLLLGGLLVALARRRFEIVLLATIPAAGAFLAGPYDFRLLTAAPAWIMAMALAGGWLLRDKAGRPRGPRWRPAQAGALLLVIVAMAPVVPGMWKLAHDPGGLYLLTHRDVAIARLMQDVVAGSTAPTVAMKPDELDRRSVPGAAPFDALACPEHAYAVAHLYLQPFDDKAVLALCRGDTQGLIGRDKLLGVAVEAIRAYRPVDGRGLRLMWEESALSRDTIAWFGALGGPAAAARYVGQVDTGQVALWVLTVAPGDVAAFRDTVIGLAGTTP